MLKGAKCFRMPKLGGSKLTKKVSGVFFVLLIYNNYIQTFVTMLYYSCWCSLFGWVITCFLFFCFVFVASKIFFFFLGAKGGGPTKKKKRKFGNHRKKKEYNNFFLLFFKNCFSWKKPCRYRTIRQACTLLPSVPCIH